ncbi:E3 ubiquitin-protein ligase UPL3 [Durusdinium trenchii]|uniref:E3 ubiquitin-protein ligase UPL3 n=1 Tax=Durusdinium trenchii TaxID=1381693 RepID=A0ABP0JZ60_9DINO
MPLIAPKEAATVQMSAKMSPELELFVVCGWGKCPKRLERVLKKKPNVNWKNEDGLTPLFNATMCGSADFVEKLIKAGAEPNVVATEYLLTPFEWVTAKVSYEEERDRRLNDFDQVNRLDDTCLAIRPDIKPFKQVLEVLGKNGGVEAKAFSNNPKIKPDGSIDGGKPSELRSYKLSPDGSYTAAHYLRSGKFDLLKYEDGRLVECDYDPKTGHWAGYEAAAA